MHKDTVDHITNLFALLFRQSQEQAMKLKALERVAEEHPELLKDYESYLGEIRNDLTTQKTHGLNSEALLALREELLRS
jgi:hypothetical protein